MKKLLLFTAFTAVLALPIAQADDSVRAAQTVLQGAGYYVGPLDGEFNADTKAALRRYQIRNQLEPTGELTAETAAALSKEGQSAPASTPEPQPVAPTPPVTQATPIAPPVPPQAQPAPPQAVPGIPLEGPSYARIFAGTPYENAPAEIQVKTLRKAQIILADRGLFRGAVDAQPGPATEEALLRFQAARELPRTGRLDIDTLAELHLLPVSKLQRPRGALIPPAPHGAVRGVPLD